MSSSFCEIFFVLRNMVSALTFAIACRQTRVIEATASNLRTVNPQGELHKCQVPERLGFRRIGRPGYRGPPSPSLAGARGSWVIPSSMFRSCGVNMFR